MRILYFSQYYNPHDHRFLEKLAQTPHDIWYLCFETKPIPLETRPIPRGIHEVDWMGNKTYKLRSYGKLKLFRNYQRILRTIRPDLVHAGPVQTCGFFTALTRFKPFLLMSWGSDILTKAYKNVISQWITKFTIKHASMIACDCLTVRNKIMELTDYPIGKIVIFPWGVDLRRFYPAPSRLSLRDKLGWQNKKVVITTRLLEPIYGVEMFLEAAKKVAERESDIRFIMLGDGSLKPKVKKFISENNLEQKIHIAGRIPNEMLPDYLNEADLYVSSSYSDGTSVSLLEAMACQLPVVVTDLSSNQEWVTPGVNGWLVPPKDAQALSSVIIEALNQEVKAQTMAKLNVSIVRQKADLDKNFTILLGAYEQLGRKGSM